MTCLTHHVKMTTVGWLTLKRPACDETVQFIRNYKHCSAASYCCCRSSRVFHAIDSATLQAAHRCTPAPNGILAAPAVLPTTTFNRYQWKDHILTNNTTSLDFRVSLDNSTLELSIENVEHWKQCAWWALNIWKCYAQKCCTTVLNDSKKLSFITFCAVILVCSTKSNWHMKD